MSNYRVNLDIFAGPLDLLLYLVRKDELDIYDIAITKITDQYLRYIEMLKSLDIDLAGDFLVTAATLMQIKSAMLLPKAEPDQVEGGELADPRAELIRQLLEYKKFKDAANTLLDAADQQKERFTRPSVIVDSLREDSEPEVDIEQVSVWDLLEAFDSIMQATSGAGYDVSHISDDTPIDLYQIEILHRLQAEGAMSFERIFESKSSRAAMIGLFLALLELIREKLVWTQQDASKGAIYLKPLTAESAEQAVKKAIIATEAEMNNQQQKPPIEIAEIKPKGKQQVTSDTSQQQTSIPISKLPPKEQKTKENQTRINLALHSCNPNLSPRKGTKN